jgi:hypothetical protein
VKKTFDPHGWALHWEVKQPSRDCPMNRLPFLMLPYKEMPPVKVGWMAKVRKQQCCTDGIVEEYFKVK